MIKERHKSVSPAVQSMYVARCRILSYLQVVCAQRGSIIDTHEYYKQSRRVYARYTNKIHTTFSTRATVHHTAQVRPHHRHHCHLNQRNYDFFTQKGAYSCVITLVSLSLLRCTPTPLRRLRTLLLRPKRRLPTIINTTVLSRLHPSTTIPRWWLMRFLDII